MHHGKSVPAAVLPVPVQQPVHLHHTFQHSHCFPAAAVQLHHTVVPESVHSFVPGTAWSLPSGMQNSD